MLAGVLGRTPWIQALQVIETAKVPIIKLVTYPECIRTDLAVNDDSTHSPIYCCSEGIFF